MEITKNQAEMLSQLGTKLTVIGAIASSEHGDTIDVTQYCQNIDFNTDLLHAVIQQLEPHTETESDNTRANTPVINDHWPHDMYCGLIAEPAEPDSMYPTTDRLSRLIDCLRAIPNWYDYAVLFREYAGAFPTKPRHGKVASDMMYLGNDMNSKRIPASDADICLQRAISHIKARRAYILTGKTDLMDLFDSCQIMALKSHAIFVMADFDQFTMNDLLTELYTEDKIFMGAITIAMCQRASKNKANGPSLTKDMDGIFIDTPKGPLMAAVGDAGGQPRIQLSICRENTWMPVADIGYNDTMDTLCTRVWTCNSVCKQLQELPPHA